MKNQLAGGRVRVDPFLQAEQGNAALLEHGDSREQLAESALPLPFTFAGLIQPTAQ
jgi:hypothetical protein